MSNLVTRWKQLNKRQNEINDQHKGSQKELDIVNHVISMGKIDLESRMSRAEKETL